MVEQPIQMNLLTVPYGTLYPKMATLTLSWFHDVYKKPFVISTMVFAEPPQKYLMRLTLRSVAKCPTDWRLLTRDASQEKSHRYQTKTEKEKI